GPGGVPAQRLVAGAARNAHHPARAEGRRARRLGHPRVGADRDHVQEVGVVIQLESLSDAQPDGLAVEVLLLHPDHARPVRHREVVGEPRREPSGEDDRYGPQHPRYGHLRPPVPVARPWAGYFTADHVRGRKTSSPMAGYGHRGFAPGAGNGLEQGRNTPGRTWSQPPGQVLVPPPWDRARLSRSETEDCMPTSLNGRGPGA